MRYPKRREVLVHMEVLVSEQDLDMKTNVIMARPMGQFEVLQRISDGFFDGAALLHQWNTDKTNPERKMARFFESTETKMFISALEEDIKNQSADLHNGDNQSFIKVKGKLSKKGRTKDQVWMHPYLFIKFAMWINPKFELQVIKFVYDELIKFRHLAGDNYNVLTASLAKLPDCDYKATAKAIQWIVFNRTGKNLRQGASQKELAEISDIENKLAYAIDMGFIKNQAELIISLRKMYNEKYRKF